MKLNQRETFIFRICIILVIVFFVSIGFNLIREKNEEISDRILLVQKKLNKNLQIIESREVLGKQYEKLISIFGSASSESNEFSRIISEVQSLAVQANVRVLNLQGLPVSNLEGRVRNYPIQLEIEGEWATFTKFLYLVQSDPALLNVDTLAITKRSQEGSSLHARVILSRFRLINVSTK